MMIADVDTQKYGELLLSVLPTSIRNDDELDRMTREFDALMTKSLKGGLTFEEQRLFELLADLIEKYEDENYPVGSRSTPESRLAFLMEQKDLTQKDLVPAVFSSQSIVSEIINGKRKININQARKLAEFFKVSVELFV